MSTQDPNEHQESGPPVEEARPKLKRPPMFKVLLLNDDYTPMEFVVQVLETFFAMSRDKATQIMLHVHTRGVGVCGVACVREIALHRCRCQRPRMSASQRHRPRWRSR